MAEEEHEDRELNPDASHRPRRKTKAKPIASPNEQFFGIGRRLFTLTDGPRSHNDPNVLFAARDGAPTFLLDIRESTNRMMRRLESTDARWTPRFADLVQRYAYQAQLCAELLCQRLPTMLWSPIVATDSRSVITAVRDTLVFNVQHNTSLCFGDSQLRAHAAVFAAFLDALMACEQRVIEAADGISHKAPHERFHNDPRARQPTHSTKRRKSGPSVTSTAPMIVPRDAALSMGGCANCDQAAEAHKRGLIHAPDWSWVQAENMRFELPSASQRLIVQELAACPSGATETELRKRLRASRMRPKAAFQRHLEQLGDGAFVLWNEIDGKGVLILAPFLDR